MVGVRVQETLIVILHVEEDVYQYQNVTWMAIALTFGNKDAFIENHVAHTCNGTIMQKDALCSKIGVTRNLMRNTIFMVSA